VVDRPFPEGLHLWNSRDSSPITRMIDKTWGENVFADRGLPNSEESIETSLVSDGFRKRSFHPKG
jgi:hypothetical protein